MGKVKETAQDIADAITARIIAATGADFELTWDLVFSLLCEGVAPIDITDTIAGETA